ncbi:DMT family transporter [Tritonibacter horizontis]|uniref:Putative amino-acid metabolite efflux pump n=1 Tax=Tritonibacter horizontis TaxID=1768241 RepID=A0A132C0V2_9RHOB|nr:DMT family transporter [Tritonibacter horizontis]KUP93737.1 putative amino-acid metabolite efflux pump [Tritonibacter horizontis]
MTQTRDLALTALAPAIWGSSYIVTTAFLPGQSPYLVALLRALPAGIFLMLLVRQLPPLALVPKILVLGALNFSLFWSLMFLAAYRLPGGVAATLGAVQPLFVLALSGLLLGHRIHTKGVLAALLGMVGVGFLVLGPEARLDLLGVFGGLAGAASMAAGVVLTRKWQPAVPALTFTAWQLMAGGVLLIPVAFVALPDWPGLTTQNLLGLAYLSLIGGALTYILWFRGIGRIDPARISLLGVFSPLTAVVLGVTLASESFSLLQAGGACLALFSVWLGQQGPRKPVTPVSKAPALAATGPAPKIPAA